MPTRMPTTPLRHLSAMTFMFQGTSYTPVMPTDVLPWDFTAIGLVSVSMAVWLGTDVGCIPCGDCTTVSSWAGHLDSKQVSTCDVSVVRSSCRVLQWFQTVQTDASNQESCRMAVTASTTRDSRQPFSLRNRMCWQTFRLSSLLWKWLHVNWNQPSHIMSLSPRRSISPMRSSRSVWTVTVS